MISNRNCYLLQLLVFMLSFSIVSHSDCVIASQSEDIIKELRYPGSFDISTLQSTDNFHVYSIRYKLRLAYPAMDVVQFYDDVLRNYEWIPSIDKHHEYADRVWQEYFDATQKEIPLVHQLIAQWKKGDRIAFLAIRYYSFDSNRSDRSGNRVPSNDVQNIYFQLMPFVATLPPGTLLPRPPRMESEMEQTNP